MTINLIFAVSEPTTMYKTFFLSLFLFIVVSVFAQNNNADTTTSIGLPVLRSYVAPDVVHRAKKKFGRQLYCIEKSTAADCQSSYLVGLIKNGKLVMEWMCDDPKMVFNQRSSGTFRKIVTTES